jgi:hypothetical protein
LRESLSTGHRRMHSVIKYAETARNLDELLSERTDPTLSPVRLDEVIRDELERLRAEKADERGGFEDGIVLERVE